MEHNTKVCKKCGMALLRCAFYAHKASADGLLGKCKECTKADVRSNRAKRLDYYRAYDRERFKQEKRKSDHKLNGARYSKRHPDRRLAQWTLNNALRDGKVSRLPCRDCGAAKVQAHHADYTKPLDVIWLCLPCHRKEHGRWCSSLD